MSNTSETQNELNFIRDEMKNNLSIRTTLLTFCFTSVITTLGFGLTHYNEIPFIIYIIPVIITVTFSCRITYYKDIQSKMNAYLRIKHKESLNYEMSYEKANNNNTNIIKNNFCVNNKFISFIINKELLILSLVPIIIYYKRFFDTKFDGNILLDLFYIIKNIECINMFYITIPIILCFAEYVILQKVPSYTEKTNEYIKELEKIENQTQ